MTNDHTNCCGCQSLNAEVLAATAELSNLRRFEREVRHAFGTADTETLHLIADVVGLAQQAAVLHEMAPTMDAARDALAELFEAVKTSVPPRPDMGVRPEDGDVEGNQQRKSGAFRGSDPLDPISNPRHRE